MEQIKIIGVSPLLYNRYLSDVFKKQRNETFDEFENRIWKEKAHFNENEELIIPSQNWSRCLVDSSKKSGIRPPDARKKNENLSLLFKSTFFPNDFKVLKSNGSPATKNDLIQFKTSVCMQGFKSQRVPSIRPCIEQWCGILEFEILDPANRLRTELVKESLLFAGAFNGIGEWRVQNGGKFGRFTIN